MSELPAVESSSRVTFRGRTGPGLYFIRSPWLCWSKEQEKDRIELGIATHTNSFHHSGGGGRRIARSLRFKARLSYTARFWQRRKRGKGGRGRRGEKGATEIVQWSRTLTALAEGKFSAQHPPWVMQVAAACNSRRSHALPWPLWATRLVWVSAYTLKK